MFCDPLPLQLLSKKQIFSIFWNGADLPPSYLDHVFKYTAFFFRVPVREDVRNNTRGEGCIFFVVDIDHFHLFWGDCIRNWANLRGRLCTERDQLYRYRSFYDYFARCNLRNLKITQIVRRTKHYYFQVCSKQDLHLQWQTSLRLKVLWRKI